MLNQPPTTDEQEQDVTVVFALSDEELAFLLHEMGLNSIPGFDAPVQMHPAVMQAARNSLRARDFLVTTDTGELEVNRGVAETVTASTRMTHLLSVTPTVGERHLFYLLPGYIVHQNAPRPGVQQFQLLDSGMKLAALLVVIMQLDIEDKTPTPHAEESLPVEVYQAARQAVKEGHPDAARQQLKKAGLSDTLVQAIVQPALAYTVASTAVRDGQFADEDGIAVVRTPDGLWMFSPQDGVMHAVPVYAEQVLERVVDMVS